MITRVCNPAPMWSKPDKSLKVQSRLIPYVRYLLNFKIFLDLAESKTLISIFETQVTDLRQVCVVIALKNVSQPR